MKTVTDCLRRRNLHFRGAVPQSHERKRGLMIDQLQREPAGEERV